LDHWTTRQFKASLYLTLTAPSTSCAHPDFTKYQQDYAAVVDGIIGFVRGKTNITIQE
jgi:hypothetical protein